MDIQSYSIAAFFFCLCTAQIPFLPCLRRPQTTGLAKDKARTLQIGELSLNNELKVIERLVVKWKGKMCTSGKKIKLHSQILSLEALAYLTSGECCGVCTDLLF